MIIFEIRLHVLKVIIFRGETNKNTVIWAYRIKIRDNHFGEIPRIAANWTKLTDE